MNSSGALRVVCKQRLDFLSQLRVVAARLQDEGRTLGSFQLKRARSKIEWMRSRMFDVIPISDP